MSCAIYHYFGHTQLSYLRDYHKLVTRYSVSLYQIFYNFHKCKHLVCSCKFSIYIGKYDGPSFTSPTSFVSCNRLLQTGTGSLAMGQGNVPVLYTARNGSFLRLIELISKYDSILNDRVSRTAMSVTITCLLIIYQDTAVHRQTSCVTIIIF